MPHDRNGKLVEVGDIVMGRGYNVKHDVIGPVLSVTEAESCNLTVGYARAIPLAKAGGIVGRVIHGSYPVTLEGSTLGWFDVEYGATKDFEIIQKADGTDAA